jgi:DNA-binding response OmpR family regulator
MSAPANHNNPKRRLLLASDRSDQSNELASILQTIGQVDTVATSEIPDAPGALSGVVVDINLRSPESVQLVRNKLSHQAYRETPRLFVLADALHHASMQAWALGATDTISRPFDAQAILQRVRSAFPDSSGYDETDRGKALNRGVEAAHAVMVRIFEKLPAGQALKFEDVVAAESKILKAIKHSSLREWLTTVGCHHNETYRHCLFVTGFAVAYAQHLGMREDDQRRLAARRCCTTSARHSFRSRSSTSPANSPWKKSPKCVSIRAAAMKRLQPRAVFRPKCSTSSCTTMNFLTAPVTPTVSLAARSATSCA